MKRFYSILPILLFFLIFLENNGHYISASDNPNKKTNNDDLSQKIQNFAAVKIIESDSSAVSLKIKDSVWVDVVVAGAGSAGVPAAVQSARIGAKTILIESGFQPGGQATSGGVNFPGLFHAWGKQIISGIGWEWVLKTTELTGAKLPDFSVPTGRQHYKHQINVNIPVYVAVAEELCAQSGVEIRYFEVPVSAEAVRFGDTKKSKISVEPDQYNWKLITSAQGEIRIIFCKQMIDCTGNGTLAKLAGAKLLREPVTQPGTFNYVLNHKINLKNIDRAKVQRLFDDAIKEGRIKPGDVRGGIFDYLENSSRNYVYGADSSTASLRTKTDLEGRRAMLRMLRFVKTLPGGKSASVSSMSPEVGVRETWRVLGDYLITQEDYVSGKKWPDSLCYVFYPVDLHDNKKGVSPKHLCEGTVPTVPLRALTVKNVPNMLAAGRCVSSDRFANSGLRVQAACMSTGQAAGAAAALAAQKNISPNKVDIQELKDLLKKSGAIVP